jgi:hypothetical protein
MFRLCLLLAVTTACFGRVRETVAEMHTRRTRTCPHDLDWAARTDVTFFKLSSQSWQDGYLAYVFQNIGVTNKFYVEFGFNEDSFEGGSGANTYALHKHFGWTGLLLDGGHSNATINLHREMIYPDNIVSLFEKYDVPLEPDYVSVDVDSTDVLILEKLLASKFAPRVLTVEYNSNFPLEATISLTPTSRWNGRDLRFGASLGAIHAVATRHGYSLVHIVPGLDAVLVRSDILCSGKILPYETWKNTVAARMHARCASVAECADDFMDSEVYFATHDVAKARTAARKYLDKHPEIVT